MESRYPFILVHGIVIKDYKFFRAFGKIEKELRLAGYKVYTAKIDGFGTLENNASQLKSHIEQILKIEKTDKINIIAHSKGGLDSKYMIENMDMETRVASLTTLCTPHRGSKIADKILSLPKHLISFVAFWINLTYRFFGDKKPDALQVCKQLRSISEDQYENIQLSSTIYCQSYSSTLKKSRDDILMGIPLIISKHYDKNPSDGLVTSDSSKFGVYRGDCIDGSISHSEIVGFAASKKKKQKIYNFYLNLCKELSEMGF